MNDRAVVLMSVYSQERAEYLDQCLRSLFAQTHMPDKIVLVKDGPLGADLESTIEKYRDERPELFQVIPLDENIGLAGALNQGLKFCDGEYVLRMDSDDISPPDRFRRLIEFMDQSPDIGVVSTAMIEFEGHQDNPIRIKPVECEHEKIVRMFPWRNPINHATACYRTQLIRDAGGYPHLLYLEDYYLWAVLLTRGVRFQNLPEPLYHCRFDRGTLRRRGGWVNFRNECFLRWYLYRNGQSGLVALTLGCAMQLVLRFSPVTLREWLWRLTRRPLRP